MLEDIVTLELQIEEKTTSETNNIPYYPVNVKLFKTDEKPFDDKDRLIVKEETEAKIEQLTRLLEDRLNSKLSAQEFEREREVVNIRRGVLEALELNLTPKQRDQLFSTKEPTTAAWLAVGIGHLLLEEVLLTGKSLRRIYKRLTYLSKLRKKRIKLRIRLNITPIKLRVWPWEFLWDETWFLYDNSQYFDGFLGVLKDVTISHSFRGDNFPSLYPKLDRPLHMLVAIASPRYLYDSSGLHIIYEDKYGVFGDEQVGQLRAALGRNYKIYHLDKQQEDAINTPEEVDIEIYVVNHSSWKKLQNILKKYEQLSFDIFHFIGHGWLSSNASKGYCLLFEKDDDKSKSEEIPASEIAKLLGQQGITLAVLNSCESSQERETALGVAQTTAISGIPAVIGMRHKIRKLDSIQFAAYFFAGLLDGKPVDFLVNDVRRILGLRYIYDDPNGPSEFRQGIQYLYPTVCLHPLDGYIFIPKNPNSQKHTKLLRELEEKIPLLATETEIVRQYFLNYPERALAPLWVSLLADVLPDDQKSIIQRNIINLLGELNNELAVYPLIEALVADHNTQIQNDCEKILIKLGQNPTALSILVDQHTQKAPLKLLEVIKQIDPAIAENAVWLRSSREYYRAVQDTYYTIALTLENTNLGKNILENQFQQIKALEQEVIPLFNQIEILDDIIDQIIKLREERKQLVKQGVERVKELNRELDLFLDSMYQSIMGILGFLKLNEVSLRGLEKAFDWILQSREELPNTIPLIEEKIEAQIGELLELREKIQVLLEEDSVLQRFIKELQTFAEDFAA